MNLSSLSVCILCRFMHYIKRTVKLCAWHDMYASCVIYDYDVKFSHVAKLSGWKELLTLYLHIPKIFRYLKSLMYVKRMRIFHYFIFL